jgi:hypothetical protein
MKESRLCLALLSLIVFSACREATVTLGQEPAGESGSGRDSTLVPSREAFGRQVAELVIDTVSYEIKGMLAVKIVNPNPDDESPLADQFLGERGSPGPHLYDGELHAQLPLLQQILGSDKPVKVEEGRVYVGEPEVLIIGHFHGDTLYVPVRLFARQFGAYVDITSTMANFGIIWPREILDYMQASGYTLAGGVVQAYAEGLIDSLDVRAVPSY